MDNGAINLDKDLRRVEAFISECLFVMFNKSLVMAAHSDA